MSLFFATVAAASLPGGQSTDAVDPTPTDKPSATYLLGPDDQLLIRVLDVEEIDGKLARIDVRGHVDVPLVGSLKAAGLTLAQFETELAEELRKVIVNPKVAVTLAEARNQPISVLGAVNTPGVYQLTSQTSLVQALSKAGGLRPDAGSTVTVTRRKEAGTIPLPGAQADPSGNFMTATIPVKSLLAGKDPREDITVRPTDTISVARAELVYVVGSVRRPGGFTLQDREHMSVLQAISMAEGMERTAASSKGRIIRSDQPGAKTEIAVDVKAILDGKADDVPLQPNDILFIPNSASKAALFRAADTALQLATGVVIYGR